MNRFSIPRDSRRRQLLGGTAALGFVSLVVLTLWLGRFVPGFIGEWFGVVAGIATTPILMEASFLVLGLLVVMTVNAWNNHRDGDELVYLDRAHGPGSETLPGRAREVVYRRPPLVPVNPDALSRLEGALDIGDHESACEILAAMEEAERNAPEVLALRIRLADASGHTDLAARLRAGSADH